ncbi:MAG: hypothetical protein HDT41_00430 [Lachnospiraceae bacterium]|nr:hypothetical protein [Lachnospiraceae bacterium]
MRIELEHKKSTLMSQTKKELVNYIQCLESNNNALWSVIDTQSDLLDSLYNFRKEELKI